MKKRRSLVHVAGLLFNQPLLIDREKADVLVSVFEKAQHEKLFFDDDEDDDDDHDGAPYRMTSDGIAVIPICGTLVRRSMGMNALSGLASYDQISDCIQCAVDDQRCIGMVLDVDSPGGEATGVFDVADLVFNARSEKPIFAVSSARMTSAAYAIGSSAERVFAVRDGALGSIGVILKLIDESEMNSKMGLKVTTITYGAKKDFGDPDQPLSKEALDYFKARVNAVGETFVSTVARNRGMEAQAIRDTQAGVYYGQDAITAGLADQIGSVDDALAAMREKLGLPEAVEEADTDGAAMPMPDMSAESFAELVSLADRAHPLARDVMRSSSHHAFVAVEERNGYALQFRRAPRPLALAGDTGSQRVTGCAIPYNSLSSDLGGFKEVYEAGCFSESIQRDDVRFLANHDPSCVIGRTAAGTARLTERADGVYADADGPDTTWFADLAVSMARGDITGMSSAFYIQKYRWEMRDGAKVRVIEKGRLVDVTTATFPAYETTSATLQQQTPAAGVPPAVTETLRARLRVLNSAI